MKFCTFFSYEDTAYKGVGLRFARKLMEGGEKARTNGSIKSFQIKMKNDKELVLRPTALKDSVSNRFNNVIFRFS